MKIIARHKISGMLFCIGVILLAGCNSTTKEEKKEKEDTAATIGSEHSHQEASLSGNQVKSEAPDAKTKVEQGYALPRETDEAAQSPINIITSHAGKQKEEEISFSFHTYIKAAENLGHTIQVDFNPGSNCLVNGKGYNTKQFHFHTPSEHLVDGMTFPMEMHIVNVLEDSDKTNPSYMVVGILFKMGAENKFIQEFLSKVPHEEGSKNELQNDEVKLEDLLSVIPKKELNSYYTYHGSLTTPPYTESVRWVVLKSIVEASEEQIMAIEKMEGNNARHIQALHDRKIYTQ